LGQKSIKQEAVLPHACEFAAMGFKEPLVSGNLTTLAPDIVAACWTTPCGSYFTLFDLAVDPPALWDEQRERIKRPR
jgi:hypothetical protein